MKNFITNNNAINLKTRLIELIKKSDELKFLVGFFYFSGIKELYKGLNEKPDIKKSRHEGLRIFKKYLPWQNRDLIDSHTLQ